jgi:hypothetical protein
VPAASRSSTRSPTPSTPARCWPTCRRCTSASAAPRGLTLTYLGDGANNMATAAGGRGLAGMAVASAPGATCRPAVVERAARYGAGSRHPTRGGRRRRRRARNSVWVSMGQSDDEAAAARPRPYAVDESAGRPGRRPTPCTALPAGAPRRGDRRRVLDAPGPPSGTRPENRLHAQKALLAFLLRTRRERAPPAHHGRARQPGSPEAASRDARSPARPSSGRLLADQGVP